MSELKIKAPKDYMIKATVDLAFKHLMHHPSDKEHLLAKSLLSAILNQKITKLEFIDREIDPVDYDAKQSRLDVNVEINNELIVNIEMQLISKIKQIGSRSVFYASHLLVTQANKGSSYEKIFPVRQIFLSHEAVFDKQKAVHNFMLMEEIEHYPLTDKLKVIIIELDKLVKNIESYENISLLEKWAYYLEKGHIRNDKNILELENEDIFARAMEVLGVMNKDQEIKDMIFIRQKQLMDEAQMREEGFNEGVEKNKLDVALKLLDKGQEDSFILEVTGIDLEQLKELKSKYLK